MASDSPTLPRWLRLTSLAGKAAAAALAVWLLLSTLGAVIQSRRERPTRETSGDAEDQFAALSPALMQSDGGWSLGEGAWLARVTTLPVGEVDERLQERPAALGGEARPLEHTDLLIRLFEHLDAERTSSDGLTVRTARAERFRAVLVTRERRGREELVEARAALPDGDHWTLWTLAAAPASGEAGGDEPLLPYPPGHEVLAVRRASRGARQAELSLAMAPIEELLALWQNAGWTIREAPPGDSPDASVPQTWLAVRGSRAVSVGLMTVADEQFLLTVAADSASPGTASGE